jgi:hypothetical protein
MNDDDVDDVSISDEQMDNTSIIDEQAEGHDTDDTTSAEEHYIEEISPPKEKPKLPFIQWTLMWSPRFPHRRNAPNAPVQLPLRGQDGVGRYTTIDKNLVDKLPATSWYVDDRGGYVVGGYMINGKRGKYRMGRVVLELKLGRPLGPHELCDHIDRDPLNNHTSNLRVASHTESTMNRGRFKSNTTGKIGPSLKPSGKYQVMGTKEGGKGPQSLGYCSDLIDGAHIYNVNLARRKDVREEFKCYNEFSGWKRRLRESVPGWEPARV